MAEKLIVTGARGPGLTEIARRTGSFGVLPNDSDTQALNKFADAAILRNPGFKGDRGLPGPSNNTRVDIAALKAAAVTDITSLYDGDIWFFDDERNYSNLWDDVIYVKSPLHPTGAWVRQLDVLTPWPWMSREKRALFLDGQLPDCTEEIQAAIDFGTGKGLSSLQAGRRVELPGGGRWKISRPLIFNWRPIAAITDDQDMRRLVFAGQGRAIVEVFYEGANGASFQGSISGNILTVSSVSTGEVHVGAVVSGNGLPANLTITESLSAVAGVGTYRLNKSLSVPSQTMTSKSCFFFIQGNPGPPTEGVNLHTIFSNVACRGRGASSRGVDGLRLNGVSHMMLDDTTLDQFDRAIDAVDCIRLSVTRCEITGSNEGVYLRADTYSQPNVIKFDRVDFGGILKQVLRVTQGSNVAILNCGIEGCGDGTRSLVYIEGGAAEGAASFLASNNYCENNSGIALFDFDFNTSPFSGTAGITYNSIRRNANDRICLNEVIVRGEGSADLRITIEGNGFESGPSYTPSPSRPVVALTSASTKARIYGLETNRYANQSERPNLSGFLCAGYGYDETVAVARVSAAGSLQIGENVAFVDVASPGRYRIHLKIPPRSATIIAHAMVIGAAGSATLTAEYIASDGNYFEISTFDATGAATPRDFMVTLKGLLN